MPAAIPATQFAFHHPLATSVQCAFARSMGPEHSLTRPQRALHTTSPACLETGVCFEQVVNREDTHFGEYSTSLLCSHGSALTSEAVLKGTTNAVFTP